MTPNSLLIAVAEATGGAPQSTEQQLLDVDWTLLVMLGLFLLATLLLTQLLWKPYIRVRTERVSRVDGYREEATRLDAEAATRLARVEAQLAEARRTASAERARVRGEAQARESAILAEANQSANRSLAAARAEVEKSLAAERATLPARAAVIGREIGEKVLGRKVTA
jgi:F0F1-type ATP synthase membrane subunit b/b'